MEYIFYLSLGVVVRLPHQLPQSNGHWAVPSDGRGGKKDCSGAQGPEKLHKDGQR